MKRKVILTEWNDSLKLKIDVDLTDAVEAIKQEKLENPTGWTKGRTFRKIASIPIDAILSLPKEEQEAFMSNDKRVIKKLLDKYPIFKTEGDF